MKRLRFFLILLSSIFILNLAIKSLYALELKESPLQKEEDFVAPFPHLRTNTPKKFNATVGRYLYLGAVPKFKPQDIEITVSKSMLTVRIKAWVDKELYNQYAIHLLKRYKRIVDAFLNDDKLEFVPLQTIKSLRAKNKKQDVQAWLDIVEPYMKHILEFNVDLEQIKNLPKKEYTKEILTSLIRYYLDSKTKTIDDGLNLLSEIQKNPSDIKTVLLSRSLFLKHLSDNFTKSTKRGENYIGYLTFVYPIAATSDGPFSIPREGFYGVGLSGNDESKWWSNKWQDEFGGMPYILLHWNGVAFHGPITNYSPLDIWFLRRGFVSHGCFRMDASDILEYRMILPGKPNELMKKNQLISTRVLEYPDIDDWNEDGVLEVMDVAYYQVPGYVPYDKDPEKIASFVSKYLYPNSQILWRRKQFDVFNAKTTNKTKKIIYDENKQTLKNLYLYSVKNNQLIKDKFLEQEIPFFVFKTRGNQIIQYREKGVEYVGFDDVSGKYPPRFFVQDLD
jgi:hypothetical protein